MDRWREYDYGVCVGVLAARCELARSSPLKVMTSGSALGLLSMSTYVCSCKERQGRDEQLECCRP